MNSDVIDTETSKKRPDTPEVSVVIPTYDRPAALARCLAALEQQHYPRNRLEVIVVDDGSPTPAAEIAEQLPDDFPLVFLRQENSGPAAARNAGAAQARGTLLVFTDDDCAPNPDWLSLLVKSAGSHPGTAIGGKTVNALARNPFSAASQQLVDYLYQAFNRAESKTGWMFTSNNLALPAAKFRAIGGFDASFPRAAAEDRELCDRWQLEGNEMHYEPSALTEHFHRLSLASYVRQHFNYGRGAYEVQRLRRSHGIPSRLEPLRFYVDLLRFPFGRQPFHRAVVVAALLGVAQVANAVGYFWQRRESR